jgi:hypothetical protein
MREVPYTMGVLKTFRRALQWAHIELFLRLLHSHFAHNGACKGVCTHSGRRELTFCHLSLRMAAPSPPPMCFIDLFFLLGIAPIHVRFLMIFGKEKI